MTNESENIWLNSLKRQVGVRQALIVHGDLLDLRYSEECRGYRASIDVVLGAIKSRGYDEVIVWDEFSGISNVKPEVWESVVRESTFDDSDKATAGSDYDVGTALPVGGNSDSGIQTMRAEDFFAVVYHHMLKPGKQRYAFVIDWSQFLFGSAKSLLDIERRWLLIISKAMSRSSTEFSQREKLSEVNNVIVFLCNNLASLPPALYLNNPGIHEIMVPSPTRIDREAFIKRSIDKWKFRVDLMPGTIDFSDFVDSTEGMAIRDLQQLVKLSRQVEGDPLTPERLISLYKYGEQKSPWEDLSRNKLRTIKDNLTKRVKGQAEAIDKVSDVIVRAFTGLSGLQHSKKQKMPKGVLFFVGPTGVGKTELAKSLAQFLFGDEDACIRFDMSEFNHEHSDQRLVGAPPGYVGYEEGGQLTNAVKKKPFSVLLFDEIEKAHVRILDKFLQILEDGRLTDGKGETVYFSETIIIFTSNIGASEVQLDDDVDRVRRQFIEKVKEHFIEKARRPELLNRLGDNIVAFNFITDDEFLVSIGRSKLQPLRDRLKEKYRIQALEFVDEEAALTTIAQGVDKQMGGRGILNEIVKRIIDPLAQFLFDSEYDDSYFAGKTIKVVQLGDGEKAKFKFRVA